MLRRAKTMLRDNNFTALYDKGYHTGRELAIVDQQYRTLVANSSLFQALLMPWL